MALTSFDDLDTFFNDAEFGVFATLNGQTIKVILDNQYAETYNASGTTPVLLAKSSDVASAQRGQTIVINTISYSIKTIEPDNTGTSRMELTKA